MEDAWKTYREFRLKTGFKKLLDALIREERAKGLSNLDLAKAIDTEIFPDLPIKHEQMYSEFLARFMLGHKLFRCNRCYEIKEGMKIESKSSGTCGYYDMEDGSPWAKYRKDEFEEQVCDDCIQSMPEYQADYPHRPA